MTQFTLADLAESLNRCEDWNFVAQEDGTFSCDCEGGVHAVLRDEGVGTAELYVTPPEGCCDVRPSFLVVSRWGDVDRPRSRIGGALQMYCNMAAVSVYSHLDVDMS